MSSLRVPSEVAGSFRDKKWMEEVTRAINSLLGGGGGGAPVGASYVVLGTDVTLTDERVLTAGANITITDGGAGGAVTIAASGGGGTGDEVLTWLGV